MAEPMRVLQFVTHMNRGGMENRLMDIYRALDRERVQLDFYTFRQEKGQFDEEIAALGGKVYYNAPLSLKRLFSVPGQIAAFLKEHPEYTVCHAHLNQWCPLILEGARRAGVRVRIAHARTALTGHSLTVLVKNLISRLYQNSPTHRFAVSGKAALWLYGKRRVARGECEVWPNAIDAKKFAFDPTLREKTRKSLGLGEEYVVLHVGNLRRVKNHDFLFSVFASILQKEPEAVLLLAGAGEREAELKELAEQLAISNNVRFLGSRSDIPDLLSAADVFVLPSFYEGLPGSVLEAQASSLPCFISDTIAHEVCVTDLVRMLSIQADPALWADAVFSSRAHAREEMYSVFAAAGYDVGATAERLTDFYLTCGKGN